MSMIAPGDQHATTAKGHMPPNSGSGGTHNTSHLGGGAMGQARVEFRLTMPGVGSWNGQWSGEGRNYTITRRMGKRALEIIGLTSEQPANWSYGWSDGWRASISARVVSTGERLKKSDGFCGYDWMVREICRHGEITTEPL